jgi:hypothetical protein
MYAELSLDYKILKNVVKKALRPAQAKQIVDYIREEHNSSISRACRIVGYSRSGMYYQSRKKRWVSRRKVAGMGRKKAYLRFLEAIWQNQK